MRSDPNQRRGRDIADIALIIRHDCPTLDELRERVRQVEENRHKVHVLNENLKDEYRQQFSLTRTPESFDQAWTVAQRLLEQVDEDHKNRWRPYWDRRSELEHSTDLLPEEEDELDSLRSHKPQHFSGPQTRDQRGRFSHNAW